MNHPVLVTGVTPLLCLRAYSKRVGLKEPRIINRLVITLETAQMADHAVKFSAICKETKKEKIFIACFKNAVMSGIYLTSVKDITPIG